MPEQFKVDYPAIIAVRAPAIPPGTDNQTRKAIEDADAIAALVIFTEQHGRCGGWSFDPAADTLRCCCGGLAFEVGLPETGTEAAA